MSKNHKIQPSDPASLLQAAIEQIESFTKEGTNRLDIKENGRLLATASKGLTSIIGLFKGFISPFISDQRRQHQKEKLNQIKHQLLVARDVIQSHSSLIAKLKDGDPLQRNLADRSVEAIQRYNTLVVHIPKWSLTANQERHQILQDDEIQGKEIRLPQQISMKYDSHAALKHLSDSFSIERDCKKIIPIHKKESQVMFDAFRMKARRFIENHLASQPLSLSEITSLMAQTPIEIEEESAYTIQMRQVIEVFPGFIMTLTGMFKKPIVDSKLMSIPILEEDGLRLSFQSIQTGFPFASQHHGWALADSFISADPLRVEQVPFFKEFEKQKKDRVQKLLFDSSTMLQMRLVFQQTKATFDSKRDVFIPLHRKLQQALMNASGKKDCDTILEAFYAEANKAPSAFDYLTRVQQKLLDLFVNNPIRKIQDIWMMDRSPLRLGTYQEKLKTAKEIFKEEQNLALGKLEADEQFIALMGPLLGDAAQSIALQYLSEKMGFAPSMLSEFEQRLQACAFQQALTFFGAQSTEDVEKSLTNRLEADIAFFETEDFDSIENLGAEISHELEAYFNSRFYAVNYKKTDSTI